MHDYIFIVEYLSYKRNSIKFLGDDIKIKSNYKNFQLILTIKMLFCLLSQPF